MVETGLVMGLIAVLAVASIWVVATWLGKSAEQTGQRASQTDTQFYTGMVVAQNTSRDTGNPLLPTTTAATTTTTAATTTTTAATTTTTAVATTTTAATTTTTSATTAATTTTTSATTTTTAASDVTAPTGIINTPSSGFAETKNVPFDLNISASDNVGVTSVTWANTGANTCQTAVGAFTSGTVPYVSGSSVNPNSATYILSLVCTTNGMAKDYTITVTIKDAANNTTVYTRAFLSNN